MAIKTRLNNLQAPARDWLSETHTAGWLAGFGYAARGVVYLIVGGYTALAAVAPDQPQSARGALEKLMLGAVGPASMLVLATGLVAYSFWRLAQGLLDADDHGRQIPALVVRLGLLFSGVLHLSLALFAATLAFSFWGMDTGGSGGGGGDTAGNSTAWLLAQPFGRWWVVGVGAAIAGCGVAIAWKGVRAGFAKWFDMSNLLVRLLAPICQFGLIARGFVLIMVGLFLAAAGLDADASVARGMDGVLQWLQAQPFGFWLLALMAAGLFAFGIYGLLAAVVRDVQGFD